MLLNCKGITVYILTDPTFSALYTTAETYANLLMMGCDVDQEAKDAWIELTVYILQQKYGNNWRYHCKRGDLLYYDQMMERRQQQQSGSQSSSSNNQSGDIPYSGAEIT